MSDGEKLIVSLLVAIIIPLGLAVFIDLVTFREPIFALVLAAILLAYSLIAGLQRNGAQERAVGTIVGQLTGWVIPTGLSWWFPPPIGGSVLKNPVNQQKLDRTSAVGTLKKVNTYNNTQVEVSYYVLYMVTDLAKFVKIGDGNTAFAALMDRSVRFYVNFFESDGPHDIADNREEFSMFLMSKNKNKLPGKDETWFTVPDFAKTPPGTAPEDVMTKDVHSDVAELAADMGITIIRALVDDVNPPQAVIDAREAEAREDAEAAKERKNAASLTGRMKELKDAFPGLSDKQVLDAIQAEKGSVKTIRVDGNAGDFTKGAALGATLGPDRGGDKPAGKR